MNPCYSEISCPCCERYKHILHDELAQMADRQSDPAFPRSVVCDHCWHYVQAFIAREREACAKMAEDQLYPNANGHDGYELAWNKASHATAKAIRDRK